MRGTVVLRALTDADGALSLPDLERATGLVRSTLDRITGTLTRMGYLFELQNNEVADGCDANTAGQQSLGRQALAFWG